MTIGQRIVNLREEKGLSQIELSQKVGVSEGTILHLPPSRRLFNQLVDDFAERFVLRRRPTFQSLICGRIQRDTSHNFVVVRNFELSFVFISIKMFFRPLPRVFIGQRRNFLSAAPHVTNAFGISGHRPTFPVQEIFSCTLFV